MLVASKAALMAGLLVASTVAQMAVPRVDSWVVSKAGLTAVMKVASLVGSTVDETAVMKVESLVDGKVDSWVDQLEQVSKSLNLRMKKSAENMTCKY